MLPFVLDEQHPEPAKYKIITAGLTKEGEVDSFTRVTSVLSLALLLKGWVASRKLRQHPLLPSLR